MLAVSPTHWTLSAHSSSGALQKDGGVWNQADLVLILSLLLSTYMILGL